MPSSSPSQTDTYKPQLSESQNYDLATTRWSLGWEDDQSPFDTASVYFASQRGNQVTSRLSLRKCIEAMANDNASELPADEELERSLVQLRGTKRKFPNFYQSMDFEAFAKDVGEKFVPSLAIARGRLASALSAGELFHDAS